MLSARKWISPVKHEYLDFAPVPLYNQNMKKELLNDETVTWEQATDNIKTKEELEAFIEENIVKQYKSFKDYFDAYVADHDLELPDIMRKSNIDKGYFYNIVNGDRQPKRDKIICLCIGAGMDQRHVNRGLRIGKYSKLDPKDERDLRIKYAINSGVKSVTDLNIILDDAGLEILK